MILQIDGLWKIVGIASNDVIGVVEYYDESLIRCELDDYLVYTDVAKYQEWIYLVMFNS
jgi:secreted trypsin-like serine protease